MLAAPLAIVLTLAALYGRFADQPLVAAALRGMGAASAGLILAMAVRLLPTQRGRRAGWVFVGATFAAVGLARWPLVWAMLGLGSLSVLLAWRAGR
jgi:chromate transporter